MSALVEKLLISILMLVATGACTSSRLVTPVVRMPTTDPCHQPQFFQAQPMTAFAAQDCGPLTTDEYVFDRNGQQADTCTIDDITVRAVRRPTRVDSDISITRGDTVLSIDFSPASGFMPKGLGHPAPLACDAEASRFFMGNVYLGVVAAFTADGRELWRHELPEFRRIGDDPKVPKDDAVSMIKAAREWGSVNDFAMVSGQYVAFQYVTALTQIRQAIFHRSGRLVGTIGPWDGVLLHPIPGGFSFATGGVAATGNPFAPVIESQVTISDRRLELAVEHFLAWCLPATAQAKWSWRICELAPASAIRWRLGDRFDLGLANMTKEIHDKLGIQWANDILTRGTMSDIAMLDPINNDRDARLKQELIAIGADVDFATIAPDF
ncbi:MAG: hypothetical protein U0V87_04365 [Acidobacteriota bacterium]